MRANRGTSNVQFDWDEPAERSVRFEVVLPPTAPVTPVWPKRTKLLAGVFVAALAAGAALAYALHVMKPLIMSTRGINEVTEFPMLGVVSGALRSVFAVAVVMKPSPSGIWRGRATAAGSCIAPDRDV